MANGIADDEKIILNNDEEKEMREGQALYEMTQTEGFKVLRKWLEDLAYHSWMDPRQTKDKTEWMWQEMNLFYASNNAKELLERIERIVGEADYLQKVKSGEIQRRGMKI